MRHFRTPSLSFLSAILGFIVCACSTPQHEPRLTRILSAEELTSLETKIRALDLPAPLSEVQRSLAIPQPHLKSTSVSSVLGVGSVLAVYDYSYPLNGSRTLVITEDHYVSGKGPLDSDTAVTSVKIVESGK